MTEAIRTTFYISLNMGLTATIIGFAILAVRLFPHRLLPRSIPHLLWLTVLFRLLVPFAPPSPWSLLNLVEGLFARTIAVPVQPGTTMTNYVSAVNSYAPLHFRSDALSRAFAFAGTAWVAGTAAALLTVGVLYLLSRRALGRKHMKRMDAALRTLAPAFVVPRQVDRTVPVYLSSEVDTPFVVGVFRPAIVLPVGIASAEEDVRGILLHERTHIRRLDNLWRLLSVLALCIYWYNPFLWWFFALSAEDRELSCDEAVLRRADAEARRRYGDILVRMSSRVRTGYRRGSPILHGSIASTPFGETGVRLRILRIAGYRPLPLAVTLLSGLFAIALGLILLTNPV